MKAGKIVIDVAFGDGGKGLVVDNLCEPDNRGRLPLVVRFSGGQQCGHTVITPEGKKHIFSSFGSGSLRGCQTFFTEDTTMYLPALMNEHAVLIGKCTPNLLIHPLAMLTTPYDVAFNRVKEELVTKHGSCGLGVGATMKRCIETPYKTYVQDLMYPEMLIAKFNSVHRYYCHLLGDYELIGAFNKLLTELLPLYHDALYEYGRLPNSYFFTIGSTPLLLDRSEVIFEGSQGVMLDMDHGVFPNVTYANTTSKNVWKYIRKWNLTPEMYYVTRCYTTRHGEGWMPSGRPVDLVNTEEEINVHNRWQGDFRIADFDYNLVRQGIAVDACYHDGFFPKKNLVVTCMDQRPDFQFDASMIRGIGQFWVNDSPRRGNMKQTNK